MPNRFAFAQEWARYAIRVMPADAGEVQKQETRRAFYAGASAPFSVLLRSLAPEAEPTEDDLRMLDDLKAEFDQFARDIAEGRA